MFGIAFNLKNKEKIDFITAKLSLHGFNYINDGLYIGGDMVSLFKAVNELKKDEWVKNSVLEVFTFKVKDFSDFTDIIKGQA